VQPSKIAWYTPRSWSLSWFRNNKARFRACGFSVRPQPAPQNLQEKFCKKIWDKSKKVLLWDSHTCVVKCGIFKICLLWAHFRRVYCDFWIITHVRGFVIFSPTTTCSAGSPGKVLQKNLRRIQKFSALRLSLICGQMWRSSKCAYNDLILTFCVSFWTIMHVLGFVSFRSGRHLICRIPRKVFAKNLGQDKKLCWDTLTRLWANVTNSQNIHIMDSFSTIRGDFSHL